MCLSGLAAHSVASSGVRCHGWIRDSRESANCRPSKENVWHRGNDFDWYISKTATACSQKNLSKYCCTCNESVKVSHTSS